MSQPAASITPPPEAFRFLAAPPSMGEAAEGAGRRFEGVAYSGDLITGHSYWAAVIFDLDSTRFAGRVPVLVDHDSRQRAGWAELGIEDGRIVARGLLMANAHGAAVAADSLAGFPWQMSVGIAPARIEEVQPGARVTVNGRELAGPAVIFRDASVLEVSFVPNGADPNTSARAFSRGVSASIEAPNMTETEVAARFSALESQIATVTAERDAARSALAEHFAAARRSEVTALFAAVGREASDAAVAPYLSLTAEQFSAVSADLRATRTAAAPSPALETEQATGGANGGGQSAKEIADRAQKFLASAIAEGAPITTLEALRKARSAGN